MITNPKILLKIVSTTMPYGKYKGVLICDLPMYYLEWFNKQGFPNGILGDQMQTMFEIQLNGLNYLLEPLKEKK